MSDERASGGPPAGPRTLPARLRYTGRMLGPLLPDRLDEIRSAAMAPRVGRPGGAAWLSAPPDFVGVGAQRSGTTRWWRLLTDHPAIWNGGVKERQFFGRQLGAETVDVAGYHRLFARPPGMLAGEWSPRYMVDPWSAPLLRQAAPQTKLLVILRDPVERVRAGLSWHLRQQDRGKAVIDRFTITAALAFSDYRRQLEHLLRFFDRRQLLVLQFERCVSDPLTELASTYAFLGVDPEHRPASLHARVNESSVPVRVPPVEAERWAAWFAEDVRELARRFPEIDLALWPHFRHLL